MSNVWILTCENPEHSRVWGVYRSEVLARCWERYGDKWLLREEIRHYRDASREPGDWWGSRADDLQSGAEKPIHWAQQRQHRVRGLGTLDDHSQSHPGFPKP